MIVICVPQAGSPFRDPLVKFLARYPDVTVELFLTDAHLRDQQWTRLFEVSYQGGDRKERGGVKFLAQYPDVTVELFLTDAHLRDQQWTRLFEVK